MDSLNDHARSIGSPMHIISLANGHVLTQEEKAANLCGKQGCGKTATHFANQFGTEKLLCDEHAARCIEKCKNVDQDLWFCKKIKCN